MASHQMLSNGKNGHEFATSLSSERTPQQHKRRSIAFQSTNSLKHDTMQQQQLRSKPAIEIYRPPSKYPISVAS